MSGGGGGGQQTTTMQPWAGSVPSLTRGLETANQRFGSLAPDPYGGDRVADMGSAQISGLNMLKGAAQNPWASGATAANTITDMMRGTGFQANLDGVKRNVLGSVIPQVSGMFSDTGGLDSSAAMDTVGRAAAEAVAPYEYGAFENQQNRMLQAAGMAPQIAGLQYLPGQMMRQVGDATQRQRQAEIDAQMGAYYEGAEQPYSDLLRFMGLAQGTAGLGGTSTAPRTGPSSGQQAVGGAMSGAAAGAMVGGPYGALVGGGLGLLGGFL